MRLESQNNTGRGQEMGPDEIIEIEKISDRIIALAENQELNPEQKGILTKIRERIERFTIRTAQISLLLSVGFGLNYKRTHQEIDTVSHQGTESFQHPDEETTHILNYIAGRESLSDEERIQVGRGQIKGFALRTKEKLPDDFDKMSLEETKTWFTAAFSESFKNSDFRAEDFFETLLSNGRIGAKLPEDEGVYKAIWSMQKEVGTPRIRWYKEGATLV